MGNNTSWDAQRDSLAGSRPGGATDFDYAAIDEALARDSKPSPDNRTEIDGPDAPVVPPQAMEAFRQTLNIIIDQVFPPGQTRIEPLSLGIKLLAFLYVANPETFGGASMKQLAERAGISRQSLHSHILKFNSAYGFKLSWQLTQARRDTMAANAKAGWDRRKALEAAAEKLNAGLSAAP